MEGFVIDEVHLGDCEVLAGLLRSEAGPEEVDVEGASSGEEGEGREALNLLLERGELEERGSPAGEGRS